MKARADDRRLFTAMDDQGKLQPPKLNVLPLQSSDDMNAQALTQALQPARDSSEGGNPVANDFARDDLFLATHPQMTLGESASVSTTALAQWGSDPNSGQGSRGSQQSITDLGSDPHWAGQTTSATSAIEPAIAKLIETFAHAKTFGSLIQIGFQSKQDVRRLLLIMQQSLETGDLYAQAAAHDLLPLLQQAQMLAMQFDAVVANPPNMGGNGMNTQLKDFGKKNFPMGKSDLYALFMARGFQSICDTGMLAFVTMKNWMFLQSFYDMRSEVLTRRSIHSLVQVGFNSFPEMNSKIAQACAFVVGARNISDELWQVWGFAG